MRIVVTGAHGQLGRALREVADGGEWIFTDLEELDITDGVAVEDFFDRERPDVVVNCAAFTNVDRAEEADTADPVAQKSLVWRVNEDGPRFLAEAAVTRGTALVHISTDFVFDGTADRPYTEEDEPAPLNVYGESKLAGERAVFGSGCRGAVVRTSWLYSRWGKNFLKAILRAASERSEIRVVADQVGCPTSAASLAGAIVKIVATATASDNSSSGFRSLANRADIYHFCDSGVVSRADFAAEIIQQAGLECRVVPVTSSEYPSPARRPLYSALDTSKITRTFGITPRPWQQPLAECIRDLKDGR